MLITSLSCMDSTTSKKMALKIQQKHSSPCTQGHFCRTSRKWPSWDPLKLCQGDCEQTSLSSSGSDLKVLKPQSCLPLHTYICSKLWSVKSGLFITPLSLQFFHSHFSSFTNTFSSMSSFCPSNSQLNIYSTLLPYPFWPASSRHSPWSHWTPTVCSESCKFLYTNFCHYSLKNLQFL